MAGNADIKQHISSAERAKWNKVVEDHAKHLGSSGPENHGIADGVNAGFSQNNFTTEEKEKLAAIQEGALNNPHPATHPWTMITGLANIANTGSWNDLGDIPQRVQDVVNGVADAATVSGGIRITISGTAPASPKNNKEIWIDTTNLVIKVMINGSWKIVGAAWR